jgi:hypothetical protein
MNLDLALLIGAYLLDANADINLSATPPPTPELPSPLQPSVRNPPCLLIPLIWKNSVIPSNLDGVHFPIQKF